MLQKLEEATTLLKEVERQLKSENNDLRDGGGESTPDSGVPEWNYASRGDERGNN